MIFISLRATRVLPLADRNETPLSANKSHQFLDVTRRTSNPGQLCTNAGMSEILEMSLSLKKKLEFGSFAHKNKSTTWKLSQTFAREHLFEKVAYSPWEACGVFRMFLRHPTLFPAPSSNDA